MLVNISAGLLILGALTACGAVLLSEKSVWQLAIPISLPFVLTSLLLSIAAWRQPKAKLILASATMVLLVCFGLGINEFLFPTKYAEVNDSELPAAFQRLVALHAPLGKPRSGEWLDKHVELGQRYREYVRSDPVRAEDRRRTIYVQPLGDLDPIQNEIVRKSADFLGLYYQLPVVVNENLPMTSLPENARRGHPTTNDEQILTGYILNELLQPRLPDDAVVLIGFTASDLWPGGDWNYVFGQAKLADRVGVWSIHRLGDPRENNAEYVRTLRRILHISAHETGHMFSLEHCIYYECCMNGANHRDELDRQPLWLCPHCQAKVAHATGADTKKQFIEMIAFAKANRLEAEADFWRKSLEAIQAE